MAVRDGSRARCWARWALALALVFVASCEPAGPTESEGGSETNFLARCDEGCGADFSCVCGVCTLACGESTQAACSTLASQAACSTLAPRVATQRCSAAPELAYCDVPCLTDATCAALGTDARCEDGHCRLSPAPAGGGTAPLTCEPGTVETAELVVLGDALIELTPFVDVLEEAAVLSGALASGENFRSYASSLTSFLADGKFSISTQYATSREEGAARVVVMNGGATDMLQNPCAGELSPACPQVLAAAQGAERLLAQMAADGVEHVVYFFYSDPRNNAALQAGLDTLRPLVSNACGKSSVACHWLDLRPLFSGHDDYLGPDGIVFSEAGARAAAFATWELVISRCIPD